MGIFRQSCARVARCNISTNCRFSALWWRSNLQKLTFITKSQQILSIILKICYIDKHKKYRKESFCGFLGTLHRYTPYSPVCMAFVIVFA
jgi:hypothetical protein